MLPYTDAFLQFAAEVAKAAELIEREKQENSSREADPSTILLIEHGDERDLDVTHGVVMSGRFTGWLVWRHPDGQWVTVKKLRPAPVNYGAMIEERLDP